MADWKCDYIARMGAIGPLDITLRDAIFNAGGSQLRWELRMRRAQIKRSFSAPSGPWSLFGEIGTINTLTLAPPHSACCAPISTYQSRVAGVAESVRDGTMSALIITARSFLEQQIELWSLASANLAWRNEVSLTVYDTNEFLKSDPAVILFVRNACHSQRQSDEDKKESSKGGSLGLVAPVLGRGKPSND